MKLTSKKVANSNHEHAVLSPSGGKKWLSCAASLACEAGIPNESGQAAVNGTAMHTMSEYALNAIINGDYAGAFDVKKWFAPTESGVVVVQNQGKGPVKTFAKPKKSDVVVTDDFVAQVSKYVDYCRPIIDAAEAIEIEYRVNLTRVLHPGAELKGELLHTFGTADLVAVLPDGDGFMLVVGDLKTGRHKVTAKENAQMMLYALGILRVYQRLYDVTSVRLVIFQPYAGGADEWETTPAVIEQFGSYASSRALKAIDALSRGKKDLKPADFRPTPDGCQWCRFADQCNAKRKLVSPEAESDLADDEVAMSPAQLKAEWDKLPLMRKHIADIEKAVYTTLMRGEKVEGLKLVEGKPGNRSWDESATDTIIRTKLEDAGLSVGTATGLMYKKVMLSPNEMEKAAPAAAWESLILLVTRKPGSPSVAPEDDKRPEYQAVKESDLDD